MDVQTLLTLVAGLAEEKVDSGLGAALEDLIEDYVYGLADADLQALKGLAAIRPIPPQHDKALLSISRQHFQRATLTEAERTVLRDSFVRLVQAGS